VKVKYSGHIIKSKFFTERKHLKLTISSTALTDLSIISMSVKPILSLKFFNEQGIEGYHVPLRIVVKYKQF